MGDRSMQALREDKPAALVLLSGNDLLGQLLRYFIGQTGSQALTLEAGLESHEHALWLIDAQSYDDAQLSGFLAELYGRGPVALVNVSLERACELVEQYPWVNGVFFTGFAREQFLQGLDVLMQGGDWLPRGLMERLIQQLRRLRRPTEVRVKLTAREREILEMVRKGLPNSEIAEQLCLSPHTIKSHVHNLLRKVGASNRAEAAFLVLGN